MIGTIKEVHWLNIDGMSITNHHTIVSALNKRFTTMPSIITCNIMASNCPTKSSLNQNNNSFSLKNVYQPSFPSIKFPYTSAKEIENIIKSLHSSNSFGYDEVSMKLLKLCSY